MFKSIVKELSPIRELFSGVFGETKFTKGKLVSRIMFLV